jgi:hypothetical protein
MEPFQEFLCGKGSRRSRVAASMVRPQRPSFIVVMAAFRQCESTPDPLVASTSKLLAASAVFHFLPSPSPHARLYRSGVYRPRSVTPFYPVRVALNRLSPVRRHVLRVGVADKRLRLIATLLPFTPAYWHSAIATGSSHHADARRAGVYARVSLAVDARSRDSRSISSGAGSPTLRRHSEP